MGRFWGFVSGSKDGRIQRPIRYVSFRSNKVRVLCQNLVKADFKDFFVGACYTSNVPKEVDKTDAPHFDTIAEFTRYMRDRKGVKYFCTSCGEEHELGEEVTPLTAQDYLDRDALSWFGVSDFLNDTEYPDAICEDCQDAILMDGGRDFPDHDLIH